MTNFGTNLTYAIPNIISILACLWLFKRYVGTFSPPLELKMVTALGASNFAFHFATFFIIWTTTTFFPTISSIAIIFSISWALHMSYLTHKAARNGTVPNSHRYSSLINLLLPSLVLAFG